MELETPLSDPERIRRLFETVEQPLQVSGK
jgi:hypothetical protein